MGKKLIRPHGDYSNETSTELSPDKDQPNWTVQRFKQIRTFRFSCF